MWNNLIRMVRRVETWGSIIDQKLLKFKNRMGFMQSMRPVFVFGVEVMCVKMAEMNAIKATKAFGRPNNEIMIAVSETIMVIMNLKWATIKIIMAIMKIIVAIMNSLFQVLNSL